MSTTLRPSRGWAPRATACADTERGPGLRALHAARRNRHRRARRRRPCRADRRARAFAAARGAALPAFRRTAAAARCSISSTRAYLAWKRDKVVAGACRAAASRRQSSAIVALPAGIAPPRRACRPADRARRACSATTGRCRTTIVDIVECPIAEPAIVAALDVAARAGRADRRRDAPDLSAHRHRHRLRPRRRGHGSGTLAPTERRAAADFAIAAGLPGCRSTASRASSRGSRMILFGRRARRPAARRFLAGRCSGRRRHGGAGRRPSAQRRSRVADLFAGAGAFALRLARHRRGPRGGSRRGGAGRARPRLSAALAGCGASRRAARPLPPAADGEGTGGLRRARLRPAARRRRGAVHGRSPARDVPLVAAVSCNPVTLARDLPHPDRRRLSR